MRIALLAHFPVHVIPGFESTGKLAHYPTWLPQLSEALAEQREFEIHWIVIARSLEKSQRVVWRNQTFHLLAVRYRARMLHLYSKERAAIAELLAELDPALVHAWGSEDCYGLAGADSGRTWLLSMQGLLTCYCRLAPMHPLEHLQAFYERRLLRHARNITVESKWAVGQLQPLVPQAKIDRVEYGVDPSFYELTWQPGPKPVAVFIGTPNSRKGTHDAIRAFADPRLVGAELSIVGDNDMPYAKEWMPKSGPNVKWLGRQTRAATAELLTQAWCLVLPTRADTSPNVVKEARVVGLPVVTTAQGGQSDYIEDGVNGFLRRPGDVEGFADALATVLASVETARSFGARKWEEQREFFRPGRTAALFLEKYRELTAGTASR